jgi:salicylate hydroxylase
MSENGQRHSGTPGAEAPGGPAGISVLGAGIAGLATAVALARRQLPCRVFEQAPELTAVGAGIQLSPNCVKLLHRWGLGDALRETAVRAEAVEMRRWSDNSLLRRTPLGAESEERFGAPYYTVHRADLHRALLERVPADTVRLNARCTAVRQHTDGVDLSFADGSRHTAGLLIGADGIKSVTRSVLVSDTPRFSGESIYRGLVPAGRVPFLTKEPKVVIWLGPGQHLVCYPVSGGELISFAATAPAQDWRTESWTARGSVPELVAAYDGWHPEARELLAAADQVGRWALHDRDPMDNWVSDRLAVVGDAAHPMLPFFAQGANQAVEDAAALAVCLGAARHGAGGGTAPARALRRYLEVRRERTAEVQRTSRGNSEMLHLPDGPEQLRRDQALAGESDPRTQEWLYGYDAEAAAA